MDLVDIQSVGTGEDRPPSSVNIQTTIYNAWGSRSSRNYVRYTTFLLLLVPILVPVPVPVMMMFPLHYI
jgi:hypothetical protein